MRPKLNKKKLSTDGFCKKKNSMQYIFQVISSKNQCLKNTNVEPFIIFDPMTLTDFTQIFLYYTWPC